jgi:phosphinothricin acetyltransferase
VVIFLARIYENSGSVLSAVAPAPDSECLIRPATAADTAAISTIYAHFVETTTATFDLVAPGEATMQRRRQAVVDWGLPYLAAELEGDLVGYCYAAPFRPREGYRFTVEDSIYVRPDVHGHGVGKLLLGELIARCRAVNRHTMVACICGVNPASVALHASLGFQTIGVLPEAGRKFGQWLDLTMLQRRL